MIISEIASLYDVHPKQVCIWTKLLLNSTIAIFTKPCDSGSGLEIYGFITVYFYKSN
jgi:hypothetical protein